MPIGAKLKFAKVQSHDIESNHSAVEPDAASVGWGSVVAEVHKIDLQPNHRVSLCTDGLTGMVSDANIERIDQARATPEAMSTKVIDAANRGGGRDIFTVAVASV